MFLFSLLDFSLSPFEIQDLFFYKMHITFLNYFDFLKQDKRYTPAGLEVYQRPMAGSSGLLTFSLIFHDLSFQNGINR